MTSIVKKIIKSIFGIQSEKSTPSVKRDGEYVTFSPGGFVFSPSGRPDFSAKTYYEVREIRDLLNEYSDSSRFVNSLEVGCGYGRLSPWIAEHAERSWAIDPDREALREASRNHPSIVFRRAGVQDMPFEDNQFDLLVSWTVLQHVPEKNIGRATQEIRRVVRDSGVVILAEDTKSGSSDTRWGRSKPRYEELLLMKLVDSRPKPVERTFGENSNPGENLDQDVIHHPNDTIMTFINHK